MSKKEKARHSSATHTARDLPGALSSFLPNKAYDSNMLGKKILLPDLSCQ